jgi:DNA-binding transcriptional regulator YiaG
MTYKEFSDKLKKVGLSKQEFAQMSGYSYQTILNWNKYNIHPIVSSWLVLYEKAKKYDELVENNENNTKKVLKEFKNLLENIE